MVLALIQEKQSLTERVQTLELDNWTMRKTLETVHAEALKQEAKERELIKQLDAANGEVMSAKVSTHASAFLSDIEHVPV
jgi:alanine dehydrogenase